MASSKKVRREYYLKNKKHINEKSSLWRKKNPERARASAFAKGLKNITERIEIKS